MRLLKQARLLIVLLLVLVAAIAVPLPATAQVPPLDDSCSTTAAAPSIDPGPPRRIVGSGSYSCTQGGTVSVTVCLLYGAVAVACRPATGSGSASASVSFLCVPGVYSTFVAGASTSGKNETTIKGPVVMDLNDCPLVVTSGQETEPSP